MSFGSFPGATQNPFGPNGLNPFGGLKPADAMGGGLTQQDPVTGQPVGADLNIIDPATGLPRDYVQGQGFVQQPKPNELSLPGPAEQPQAFPNLMQNPAFNPIVQQPQQLQNIAQGQPTLVNQLAPPPPQGPAPGTTITQQPAPFPQAQPAPQPQPQPTLRANPAFAQPPRPVLNPRAPTPAQANINNLAQVMGSIGRNPTFAPGAAGQFTLNQLPTRAPAAMQPQQLQTQIRQPAPGVTMPRSVAMTPFVRPMTTTPRAIIRR